MARGEILQIRFPDPGKAGPGKEQYGDRPAVVVDADLPGISLPTLMAIPFTKNLGTLTMPFTFLVNPSRFNGLTMPSSLLIFQIRAIDRDRILRRLGRLEEVHMRQMDQELKRMLGLL